ncbi:unnamed protein product [Ilex paraguariensis]|uniref:DNA-directed RNA polymerase n=1 Tax=Ilex paraguariensis TaxID=185542 RepID=A0ABC8RBY3_9AQUA
MEVKVRIHRFLEKTKRKNALNNSPENGSDPVAKSQEKLRKKVTTLMKKQKVQQVRGIVKEQDDTKPWGQDAQVKVGCRLIQLLLEKAYIQPPIDQIDDGPPDIRPAFIHTLQTVETQRGSRRYGVIQCDPLVRKGLEKTVRIHRFLEKTKRKNALNNSPENGSDPVAKSQEKLRKKVTTLMKKQKVQQVRGIVKEQDDTKPWGQDAQVKVGCRLIQLLLEKAYIQPPIDQIDDGPPDIRPAFIHTLQTVETQRGSRRYGVIQCDPLVRKGLEKTARHMVIPYMPMLIPPLNWTGYGALGLVFSGYGALGLVFSESLFIFFFFVNQVRIHRFLEKTKRKNALNNSPENGSDPVAKSQEKLRKKVTTLMKKQKVQQVRGIVKEQDDTKPWGQDAQVKVGCRLIQLLLEKAYIQPPIDQIDDGPPDIRPAFIHTLQTVETQRGSRRYGVIQCDPLVRKGLEKTARHMVIPYMPMLIPPLNWTGYDRGAYLFLPSFVMRTHGAKQQRDAVKRVPKKQLEPVFEALNTLGITKWRVNKRVLGVVDRIWASGGRLADLVDCEDVPLPEEPDTDDEAQIRKWKWKVKAAKKENSERHSQRCDIELKLAVRSILIQITAALLNMMRITH